MSPAFCRPGDQRHDLPEHVAGEVDGVEGVEMVQIDAACTGGVEIERGAPMHLSRIEKESLPRAIALSDKSSAVVA
jgi:hypothetical protein